MLQEVHPSRSSSKARRPVGLAALRVTYLGGREGERKGDEADPVWVGSSRAPPARGPKRAHPSRSSVGVGGIRGRLAGATRQSGAHPPLLGPGLSPPSPRAPPWWARSSSRPPSSRAWVDGQKQWARPPRQQGWVQGMRPSSCPGSTGFYLMGGRGASLPAAGVGAKSMRGGAPAPTFIPPLFSQGWECGVQSFPIYCAARSPPIPAPWGTHSQSFPALPLSLLLAGIRAAF